MSADPTGCANSLQASVRCIPIALHQGKGSSSSMQRYEDAIREL
jgi:hypothetical protein